MREREREREREKKKFPHIFRTSPMDIFLSSFPNQKVCERNGTFLDKCVRVGVSSAAETFRSGVLKPRWSGRSE